MLTMSVAHFVLAIVGATAMTVFTNHILAEGFDWNPRKAMWASLLGPIVFPILVVGIILFIIGEGFYYGWVGMCRKGAR